MDGHVGPAVGDGRLHLLHEDPLAPDVVERDGRAVTRGAHDHDLDLGPGCPARRAVGHQLGLAQRQR